MICGTRANVPIRGTSPSSGMSNEERWPPASAPWATMTSAPDSTERTASCTEEAIAITGTPAARARSWTSPGSPRPTLTTVAPDSRPALTSSRGVAGCGAGGASSGSPSSRRRGSSAERGSSPRRSGGVGAATRTFTASGAAVRARARATSAAAASAVMALRPKVPRPPASDTAATSSGVV